MEHECIECLEECDCGRNVCNMCSACQTDEAFSEYEDDQAAEALAAEFDEYETEK